MSYHLSDFTNYNGEILEDSHNVLVWSKKDGYFFTQYGKAIRLGYLITGMEK